MKYKNPILPGMHPDPSVCRVGKDYFLVNSSFEYFPGIPVFHSRDLLHWEQLGHCIERTEQLTLRKGFPGATGTYAPTIRYHEGTFYVVCTNVAYGGETDGNFFVWTKDPFQKNAWSDPVRLETPGIDPSFYFEGEHAYYTGAAESKIFLCEIDIKTGKYIKEPVFIWNGTGGNDPEGPHLYKKDNWYYLMISEGGTELGHMVTIARSHDIYGPYEPAKKNPILTNRSIGTEIKAAGHADIFDDHLGNYHAVCLGTRSISYPFKHNLGRETMLLPVIWEKGAFPVLGTEGRLETEYDAPSFSDSEWLEGVPKQLLACTGKFYDDFSSEDLNPCWNFIYEPADFTCRAKNPENTGLLLKANGNKLCEDQGTAFLGHRQEHHEFEAETKITFSPMKIGDETGLTIYLNHRHHYEIALQKTENETVLLFRRQIGTLVSEIQKKCVIPEDGITLKLSGTKEKYSFSYSMDGINFQLLGEGEAAYLTTEVGGMFTGNYIGLYTAGKEDCTSLFHYFKYSQTL